MAATLFPRKMRHAGIQNVLDCSMIIRCYFIEILAKFQYFFILTTKSAYLIMNIFNQLLLTVRDFVFRLHDSACRVIVSLLVAIAAVVGLGDLVGAAELVPGESPNWPETALPPARGNTADSFYAEKPIARWSVVSMDSYKSQVPVGLVAFHGCGQALNNEGIEKVEFIANNGSVTTVTDPSPNPKTGLWEWWAYLQPRATDGVVEVRAVIYPYSGQCRILQGNFTDNLPRSAFAPNTEQSIVLWSNRLDTFTKPDMWVSMSGDDTTGTGTQANPFRTISEAYVRGWGGNIDFGRVILTAGFYPYHRRWLPENVLINNKSWVTVEAAPGLGPNEVSIGGNTEPNNDYHSREQLVSFKNLKLDYSVASTRTINGPSISNVVSVWLNGVTVRGANPGSTFNYFANSLIVANTASERNRAKWSNFSKGPVSDIVAGMDVSQTSGDVFTGSSFIRDWTVKDTALLPDQHPDIWQSSNQGGNAILMDGRASASATQLLFLDGNLQQNTNVAFVNTVLAIDGVGAASHMGASRHLLFWNLELLIQPLLIYPVVGPLKTFGAVGCIFANIAPQEGQTTNTFAWDSNQFTGGVLHGVNGVTTSANYDKLFRAQTPATISKRTVRWDINQKERKLPYQCGAYARKNFVQAAPKVLGTRKE